MTRPPLRNPTLGVPPVFPQVALMVSDVGPMPVRRRRRLCWRCLRESVQGLGNPIDLGIPLAIDCYLGCVFYYFLNYMKTYADFARASVIRVLRNSSSASLAPKRLTVH